jgi:cytochrome P450
MFQVWVNLWALHHDEQFWEEPFKFRPERYLDAEGQLVPADHPNRRRTMPFGAGVRVCVGEVFAVSRMFLIVARILQNFSILPETSPEQQPSCDPRDMKMGIALLPPEFKIRIAPID